MLCKLTGRALAAMAIMIVLGLYCSADHGLFGGTEKIVSVNSQTSPCGGFTTLSKRGGLQQLIPEDTATCLEDALFWRYDSGSLMLTLVRRNISANCAARMTMFAVRDEAGLVVRIRDLNTTGVSANCDCSFDLCCEVPEIGGTLLSLVVDTVPVLLNLDSLKGKVIVRPLEYLYVEPGTHIDLSSLSGYPHLTALSIGDAGAYSDLTPVGALTSLTTFSCNNVESIEFLASCTLLENLTMYDAPGLVDLSVLKNMPKLSHLSMTNATSLNDVAPIAACTALTSLSLSGSPALIDISAFAGLVNLQTLSLRGIGAVSTLQPLARMIELSNLSLESLYLISSLEPLRNLTRLSDLSLSGGRVITDISPLAGLKGLKTLNLVEMMAIADFSPLLSCLDKGDVLSCIGTTIPREILEQLTEKGVLYKGRERM